MQTRRPQLIAAWLALPLGLASLASGLLVADTAQWRLQLLAGLWLLTLLPRARAAGPPSAARSMGRLVGALALGIAAVALNLAREQTAQAPGIHARAQAIFRPLQAEEPAGTPPEARTALGSGYVWPTAATGAPRGRILDRSGAVLASDEGGARRYSDPAFAHIVGFASRLYGEAGVEASADGALSGADSLPPEALLRARLLGTPAQAQPADVRLTIDAALQRAATEALGDRPGAVVLLDVRTGAVLAMADYPRFDPNALVLPPAASEADVARVQAAWQELSGRADSPLLNRAAQGRYPPGSIIKTLTAAAALDAGVLAGPSAQVTCPNRLPVEAGAPPVRNAVENLSQRTGDPSDLLRVYAFSCNTAFAQIGLALGPERFADYAGRFGMLLADAPPQPADLRDIAADVGTIAGDAAFLKRPAALADTAFGQGQALVTPLDMARVAATIGNDGVLMRPFLIQEVRSGGVVRAARPERIRQAISVRAAEEMRIVMRTSVQIGYAAPVALPGVSIGAKTGTAETPSGVPHSWFMAIAPAEQPRFAIAVIVEHGGEGSRSALPVARAVLAAALGVKP